MKKRILTIFTAFATLLLAVSCSRINRIEVKSCAVESLAFRGTRGVDAVLLLEIDNPAMQFTLEVVDGVLYYKGEEYLRYSAEPVRVSAKRSAAYPLPCKATLSPEITLLKLMGVARNIDMNDVTTDVRAKVTLRSGASKTFTLKNMNVGELMK